MKTVRLREDGIVILPNLDILVENVETGEEWTISQPNLVVDTGLNLFRDMILGTGQRPSHLGVGTDSTAAAAGNTDLGTEVFRALITRRTSSITKQAKFETFLGTDDANGNALVEAGLGQTGLQNGDAGDPWTLIARATHGVINKTVSIQVTYSWTLTLSAV